MTKREAEKGEREEGGRGKRREEKRVVREGDTLVGSDSVGIEKAVPTT